MLSLAPIHFADRTHDDDPFETDVWPDDAALAQMVLPLAEHDARVRAIGLGDRSFGVRREWIAQWAPYHASVLYREADTHLLTQANGGFDLLVFHGDDYARLSRIVREARDLLPSKAIVCVLTRPDALLAANLLQAGADHVADLSHDAGDAALRTRAILRRLRQQRIERGCANLVEAPSILLRQIPAARLSRGEARLVRALEERINVVVNYGELVRSAGGTRSVSPRCVLAVLISRIRTKLPQSYWIRNESGRGYALHCGDPDLYATPTAFG